MTNLKFLYFLELTKTTERKWSSQLLVLLVSTEVESKEKGMKKIYFPHIVSIYMYKLKIN